MGRFALAALVWLMLVLDPAHAETSAAPAEAQCPRFLPATARCWRGQAAGGGYYWIAMPAAWNGALVVHAHGGPRLRAPRQDDPLEDLERFAVTIEEGFAWAGSTYRRGGYGVRMAAADTEELRRLFWETFGRPRRTLLHGQSWGGNVAAKAAELYARDETGGIVWDGVILTNGMLAGGTRAYQFRVDLRVVYQYYCRNHPLPNEPQYPLWQGLPPESAMTRADLAARVRDCTGAGARSRTSAQRRNLRDILNVVGIEEAELVSHLAWATFTFRDLVARLEGRNPFGNAERLYSGSRDDEALNRDAERFSADPDAVAMLANDADLTGEIAAPVLTIHAQHDPIAFVSNEAAYRETVVAAGREELLLQTFTNGADHSRLSAAEFSAGLTSLIQWLDSGRRPSPQNVAEHCREAGVRLRAACGFDPDFTPPAFDP